jgi:hypothetical protein
MERVLSEDCFRDQPPVLVDIGASNGLNPAWKAISGHCICLAFDADDRDIDYLVEEDSHYRRLIRYNRIVVEHLIPCGQ